MMRSKNCKLVSPSNGIHHTSISLYHNLIRYRSLSALHFSASIGFSFSLQDDFDTRFKHLVEFKKEFGHTKVPVFYTGYNNLGRWAKRMRDGIRNSEPWMDDVRKTRLLGIDFDIAARHVFGHKPKKKFEDEDCGDVADEADGDVGIVEVGELVEDQAVAAATTMARMVPPFGSPMGGPQFFYHGYPNDRDI